MDGKMDKMLDKQDQMLNKQDRTIEEIKGLREDIQPGFSMQFRQIQEDIRAIKERLSVP